MAAFASRHAFANFYLTYSNRKVDLLSILGDMGISRIANTWGANGHVTCASARHNVTVLTPLLELLG